MAGKFVTILNPGYSTLYTRDLAVATTDQIENSDSMNVFNPDSTYPLQEGEWLSRNDDGKLQRGVTSAAATSDVHANLTAAGSALSVVSHATNLPETRPCYMYFQERGRYDAQLTRKGHVIVGPSNFEFRTKMVVCGSDTEVGDRVYVYTCIDSSSRVVQALVSKTAADASSATAPGATSWYAGTIVEYHGTNDVTILFQPGFGA